MNKTEKLLRKLTKKDSRKLEDLIERFLNNDKNLDIKKISKTDFYRLKKGRFRIIFHYKGDRKIIDSIKLRDEGTYRNIK